MKFKIFLLHHVIFVEVTIMLSHGLDGEQETTFPFGVVLVGWFLPYTYPTAACSITLYGSPASCSAFVTKHVEIT